MSSLRVTITPVALRPPAEEPQSAQLRVSTLRPGGEWLSTAVSDPGSALRAAREMLDEAVHPDARLAAHLENVGVDYTSGEPHLLLTSVLPIAAAELDNSPDDWPLLTPWVGDAPPAERVRLLRLDPVQAAMIAYWRQQLVATTAVFDFLPQFFTLYQARSVYSSVWGERQPDGNFQRWLLSAEGTKTGRVCREVEEEEARLATQTEFAERLAEAATGISPAMVKEQWDPKIIGTSSAVAGLAGLSAWIPAAYVIGAVVGATISYQRTKGTGRPPRWYSRTIHRRADLKTWYPVRPPATRRPPVFVD